MAYQPGEQQAVKTTALFLFLAIGRMALAGTPGDVRLAIDDPALGDTPRGTAQDPVIINTPWPIITAPAQKGGEDGIAKSLQSWLEDRGRYVFVVEPPPSKVVLAHFSPVALASSGLVLGKGREIGLWNVSVCSNSQEPVTVATPRVLMAAPQIRFLTTAQALAVIAEKGKRTGRERFLRLLKYASVGAAIASSGWAVVAVPVIDQIEEQLESRRPNIAALLAELAPAEVALGPGQCKVVTIAASLSRDARPIGPVEVNLP